MTLIDSFANYYNVPSVSNVESLWNAIVSWDGQHLSEFQKEIRPLWERAKVSKIEMGMIQSNGSTRPITSYYPFGPHHLIWHHLTETSDLDTPILYLLSPFPRMNIFLERPQSLQNIWTLNKTSFDRFLNFPIDVLHPKAYDILFHTVRLISAYYQSPIKIESYPSIFLRFFHDPAFIEVLHAHLDCVHSFQSSFWDPLFDAHRIRKIRPVNDYMIDWSRGIRFYTCTAGRRHFLPTFLPVDNGIIDLLNLSDKTIKPIEDWIQIDAEHPVPCACGKKFYPYEFIPHLEFAIRSQDKKPIYDCSIAEGLQTPLSNLQFIQNLRGTVEICYISGRGEDRLQEQDRDKINSFFDQSGLKTKWNRDQFLMLGRRFKLVSFWRNKLDLPLSSYNHYQLPHWEDQIELLDVPSTFFDGPLESFRLVQTGFQVV